MDGFGILENEGICRFFRDYVVVVNRESDGATAVKMMPSETRFSV
jgi:hypothetical protein